MLKDNPSFESRIELSEKEEMQLERIEDLFKKGYEIIEIAKQTGIKASRINMIIEIGKETDYLYEEKEEVVLTPFQREVKKQIEMGHTKEEIMNNLKRSKSSINRDIHFLECNGLLNEGDIEHLSVKHKSESNKRIKELFEQGYTIKEIVEQTGFSYTKVEMAKKTLIRKEELKNSDVVKEAEKKRLVCQANIKKLYEQGKKIKDIAKELGYSESKVTENIKILQQIGEIPVEQKKITDLEEKVLPLAKEGYSRTEISKKIGASYSSVNRTISNLQCKGILDEKKMQQKNRKRKTIIMVKNCIKEKKLLDAIITLESIDKEAYTTKELEVINKMIMSLKKARKALTKKECEKER